MNKTNIGGLGNPNPGRLNNAIPDLQIYRSLTVAKIIAVNKPSDGPLGGLKVYEWQEQTLDTNGESIEATPSRAGVYLSSTDFAGCLIDLNDQEIPIGSYVWVRMRGTVAGQVIYETVYGNNAGEGGNVIGCSWLLDVADNKAFELTALGGSGRCGCMTGATITTNEPFYLVRYTPNDVVVGVRSWTGTGTLSTCCGCAQVILKFEDGSLEPTLLLRVNQKCNESPPTYGPSSHYDYEMVLVGCSMGTALEPPSMTFVGAGAMNCSGDNTEECDNTFKIKLECIECEEAAPLVECTACRWDRAAPSYILNARESFTNPLFTKYNGIWTLYYNGTTSTADSGVWKTEGCDAVDVQLVITRVPVDADGYGFYAEVTLSGADGGVLTYSFGPSGRGGGPSPPTFQEYNCQDATSFLFNQLDCQNDPVPEGVPDPLPQLAGIFCEAFLCCSGGDFIDGAVAPGCLSLSATNVNIVCPNDTPPVDCSGDAAGDLEQVGGGADLIWFSTDFDVDGGPSPGTCIGAGEGGSNITINYKLACTSDGWALTIVPGCGSIGTDDQTVQLLSTNGMCPDPFELIFPAFSVTDPMTGDSYSHDSVVITLCEVMGTGRAGLPAEFRQPTESINAPPQPSPRETTAAQRKALDTLKPACQWEGDILERCTSCGNKQGKHVRACNYEGHTATRCTRGRNKGDNPDIESCITCPNYSLKR